MNYIEYLYNLNPNKIKLGLDRTRALLNACNNPERNLNIVQIIGTNGKGSVTAMLHQVFCSNRYTVGMFTSPHLVKINERIQINFKYISDIEIIKFIQVYQKDIERIEASFFEVMTVMSLWYFNKNKVNLVFLETGLGGAFDSVTACRAQGILITSISKDHEHILGKTLKKIIQTKLGAIMCHTRFVLSVEHNKYMRTLINKELEDKNKNVFYVPNNSFNLNKEKFFYLKGNFQYENGSLAYYASQKIAKYFQFPIKANNLKNHILNTYWPGRMQILSNHPTVMFDVCHNAAGIDECEKFVRYNFPNKSKKYLLVAFENNKNIEKGLSSLCSHFGKVIISETNIKKSKSAIKLKAHLSLSKSNIRIEKNVSKALSNLLSSITEKDILLIIGSHYLGPYIDNVFKNCFAKQL